MRGSFISLVHGDHRGKGSLQHFDEVAHAALGLHGGAGHGQLLGVADLGEAEYLCHARAHLAGVAVRGAFAEEDQVDAADLIDGFGQHGSFGGLIGGHQSGVGHDVGLVGAHGQSFLDGVLDLAVAFRDGERDDFGVTQGGLQLQGGFHGVLV